MAYGLDETECESNAPDSGTDQLTGLAGKMTIKIADCKHSYDFEYILAETSCSELPDLAIQPPLNA